MTFRAVEVYDLLEPLLKDFRKIRNRNMGKPDLGFLHCSLTMLLGGYELTFMDEFVDSLLTQERVCDIILPRLQKRQILEENGDIGPRKSRLLDAMEGKEEEKRARGRSRSASRSQFGSPKQSRSRSQGSNGSAGSRYVSRSRSRSRSGSPGRFVSRSPSRSPSRSRSKSQDAMDVN